jgi:inorganic pyrophosphatase
VVVFVEIPAGSRNKYEFDAELGGLVLDRRLFTSMTYPADYGYVEGTLGEDGDPLDALVLVGDPTFPGCRIRVRAVGVFHMTDEKGADEKVICVPLGDPSFSQVHDVHDIPGPFRDEDRALLPGLQGSRGEEDRDAGLRQPRRRGEDRRGGPEPVTGTAAGRSGVTAVP